MRDDSTDTLLEERDEPEIAEKEIQRDEFSPGFLLLFFLSIIIGLFVYANAPVFGPYIVVILILIVILAAAQSPRLKREQIIDQWDAMLENGEGTGASMTELTKELVLQTRAPGVEMKQQYVSPGFIRGALGGKRVFLVISNTSNPNLKPFRMYINARDYGNCLQVSWYLVQEPGFWQKLINVVSRIPIVGLLILPFYILGRLTQAKQAGILGLDIFDEQDLRAYVSCAHHCVLEAVKISVKEQDVDLPKIDRRSKGFLGIS